MFPSVLTRRICTGWKISVTGVFPVSYGGAIGSRHITVRNAERVLAARDAGVMSKMRL